MFSKLELTKNDQPSKPGVPTSKIVTTGIYAYSRNPIYVGVISISISIAFLTNSCWFFLSTLVLALILNYIFVIPEEAYLLKLHPKEFGVYMKNTRRWL